MRSGKVEKAAALSIKIGDAIKKHNTAEFSNVDVLSDSKNVWAKVRQLTGRSKATIDESLVTAVTADSLNKHYANVSTDAEYRAPPFKSTANTQSVSEQITEWRVFNSLEGLRRTATGLDGLPSWFLKVGAPFFAAPIADMFNLSMSSSVVPNQWKAASITPVPKIMKPLVPADYRPISITPVLSRVMERIIIQDYIYPSLQCPPPGLTFDDQFAFRPAGSTTAALIKIFQELLPCWKPIRTLSFMLLTSRRHLIACVTVNFLTSTLGWTHLIASTIGSSTFFETTHIARGSEVKSQSL